MYNDAVVVDAAVFEPVLIDIFSDHYAEIVSSFEARRIARLHATVFRLYMGGLRTEAFDLRADLFDACESVTIARSVVFAADAEAFAELATLIQGRFRKSRRLFDAQSEFLRHAIETFLPNVVGANGMKTPRRSVHTATGRAA